MDEIVQSDANESQVSSEPVSDGEVSQPEPQSEVPQQEVQAESSQESLPFHDHPRWQEIQTKNRNLERTVQELQQQMQQSIEQQQAIAAAQPRETDPLMERIKNADPEFAQLIDELVSWKDSMSKDFGEVKDWRETQSQAQLRQTVDTQINSLHDKYEIPQELRTRYDREIAAYAQQNPELGIEDLPRVYETIHKDYNTFLDSVRRAERAKYVTDKRTDAAAPSSQPKGVPATAPQQQNEMPTDPEAARREIVRIAMAKGKGSSDF